MAILDTDVIIDYIDGVEEVKEALEKGMADKQISTTIITQYELLKGAETEDEQAVVAGILSNLTVQLLDWRSITESSIIFRHLKKKGKLIPEPDILIAGFATSRDEVLITRDSHFKMIPNLKLIFI